MKILMINKFLHPNGGAETYIFKLGEKLKSEGHEVQYFGMEHQERCVENMLEEYITNVDFHEMTGIAKFRYAFKTIYSIEAKRKIIKVLEKFKPDVCHINNFNYQLTPSIITGIHKWRSENGVKCKIVFTAHDLQLVCPNHQCKNPITKENCEKCLGGNFLNCAKNKCIHGAMLKSIIGTMEATFWKWNGVYKHIDKIICCSKFLKTKMDVNPLFAKRTIAIHNFVEKYEWQEAKKKEYILYFGRFSEEKGLLTLIEVCKELTDIQFVFAGTGPLNGHLANMENVKNVGFQAGQKLERLIREARFSIYPSEWYENCPFSVMESQVCETPVLGANIGGIPELINDKETGELFESGSVDDLKKKIRKLWDNSKLTEKYRQNCKNIVFDTVDEYYEKLMVIYQD